MACLLGQVQLYLCYISDDVCSSEHILSNGKVVSEMDGKDTEPTNYGLI
jgi:hypothetical protein